MLCVTIMRLSTTEPLAKLCILLVDYSSRSKRRTKPTTRPLRRDHTASASDSPSLGREKPGRRSARPLREKSSRIMGNAESRAAAASNKNSSSSSADDDSTNRGSGGSGDARHSLPDASEADLTAVSSTEASQRRHSMSAPSSRHSSRRTRKRHSNADIRRNRNGDVEAGGIERGQEATEEQTGQLGYWYLIKNGYTELVNLIIRPPRAHYDAEELGPQSFAFSGREYQRIDFTVENDRHQLLQCSHWLPVQKEINGIAEFPCLIYLHGNSSCRLESLSVLRTCLASGLSVVAFDCAGCGKSDGDYISLGYYERDDLKCVMEYLRKNARVSTIGLWGRSMGAATALLHADRDPSIAGIVVDSAFTNLEQLVQEIVERGRREGFTIPSFLVKIVMKFIRGSVQKRAVFDIKNLSPIDHANISFVPALFVAANGDDFIGPHHSDQIFAQYAGDKNIVKVAGDHNSVRPQFLLDSAGIFLQSALQVDPRLIPDTTLLGGSRSGRTPWSSSGPSSLSRLMMMDLEAALHAGPNSTAHIPQSEWSCPTCTLVNAPLRTHCEMCQTGYKPPTQEVSSPKRWSSSPTTLVRSNLDTDTDDSLVSSAISQPPPAPSNMRTI